MWDERYSEEDYVYGKEPNRFLVSVVTMLEPGKTLCLAEGEGRNAVYLASLGFDVLAIDASSVGLEKARRLAEERSVTIETKQVDLADFDMGEATYENIVSMFCHLEPALRRRVHASVVRALRPGGMFVLEAFRPEQLKHSSGGPKEPELLMSAQDVIGELAGLEMVRVGEVERRLDEGKYHQGLGSLLEIVARKPYVHVARGAVH
jgi:SAM-dependent methyltransferase